MPPTRVHFNGSVNLADSETVLRELATRVPMAHRLPDGEPGPRGTWIVFQLQRLLETPGLERVEPSTEGHVAGLPSTRLADGVDPDTLAWPDLRYAAEYRESYGIVRRLRAAGVVRPGVRFQVEYPTPFAVMGFVDATQRDRVGPSYTRALLADLDTLLAAVPHDDLAVQWDVATEINALERGAITVADVAERVAGHADHVPDDVPVGVHLCYGDYGHRHSHEPVSLATQVELAGALADRVRRPLNWISFTVPQGRDDRDYFAPLAGLRADPATELYFALVPYHPDRQSPGSTDAQVGLVDEHLGGRSWGICAECGLGRVESSEVPRLLDRHRAILEKYA